MGDITRRPYRSLVDFPAVYKFMIDQYSVLWKNGCPAPFFEYGSVLYWWDQLQTHRYSIWEESGNIVAFCFYDSQVGSALFNLKEGYELLTTEMIEYAKERLSDDEGNLELKLFSSQKAFIQTALNMGYQKSDSYIEYIYFFSDGSLNYQLPEGFSFETAGQFDMKKMIEASWRGFNHDNEPDGGIERGYHLIAAPHATPELDVIVKNEKGEYVCYAGMWLVPENQLAYMEPLCTVPEYRYMGLASCALSELYRRTKPLGATHMTGGHNGFYPAIGFKPTIEWTIWKK